MPRSKIPKCFILCLSMVWIFACSPTDSQIKKEETDFSHIRDCENHYRRQGDLISSPIYETWMKYDQCGLNLEICEERQGWLRVHLQNGREGWMSKKAVSENSKILSPPPDPGRPANSSKPQAPLKARGPM